MKKTYLTLVALLLFSACNVNDTKKSHIIANIPEASGISYCNNTDTLVVANDEGSFYEIDSKGNILSSYKLGNYDFEGVVCEENNYMFAIEGKGLLQVNRNSLNTKLFKLKGSGFKITKKHGIEGLVKIKKRYYLSIQAKNKKDSKLLVVKLSSNFAKVKKVINHKIIDSSALAYKDKKLYILSDTNDALYIYKIKKNRIKKEIRLPKFAQEGIAFGKNDDIFFADDDGAVLKYKLKELGL